MELDRCAAYVAARVAFATVERAIRAWPAPLAARARSSAFDALEATSASLAHDHASSARRRLVRDALAAALQLATACDVARASGFGGDALDLAHAAAGRSIVAIAMLLHANVYVPNA
jgi:hypothetical protein